MQGAIALSPETQELLRSKPSKLTQLTQEQIDILKNWPEASRDLYHASQNAKRLLDDANLDDTLAWNAAEALKNIYIDATGNDIYRGREWRNFNEANQDFANGREALQRFYDIVSGTAKGDPRDPKVQAAALIGEENRAIMQEMAAWEKSYRESLSEKQANLEAQYRNDPGFFAELDEYAREKKIQEKAQENIDLGVQQARRRWLTEKAKQMGFYPEKVENDPYYDQLVADEDEAREAAKYARAIDPRQPYQRLVPAMPKEVLEAAKAAKRRKDYEPIAKDNIAYNALMTRLAQNAAFSQFVEIADTLNQSERELILRAFDAGKEGIDINSHEGGKTWEELGLPEPENRAVADILGGRDAYYQTLPNVALASNIDPAHEETVRNLISLARGRVEDPQFFTDLWNRLVASTDRTFGNVPRFIDAMAKDLTVGAYNYFADEDLYANYTAQARAEAIQEAKWDAATAPLYYEPGYGWFGDGIIGITEQLPIWGVLAAGGTVKALSSGTIPGVEIAMGVLALGYAEDTRQQLLIDGADPLTALVAGATSGVVQSWLERAQAETLIGKGWSGNLLAVASRDIRGTVANAFYKRTLKEFGTWQFAQAAFRFGGGMAISGFQEAVQEGLQAGADRFISDLALKDPSFERALKASVDEFVATLPMMMMTAGLGGTVRVTRDVPQAASVGKQLRILTGQGIVGKEAEAALASIGKTMDFAGLREAWRNASNDRARIKLLMDVGHLPKTQATALHAYLIAEEKIADRHDALAMELAIDMSNEGAKTFANNPEAIRRVMTAIGLRNVQVEAAAIGSLNSDNSKNERDGWRVTADVGNGRTVTFTVGVMTEQESTLDGSAATASSAWEYLKNSEAIQKELKGMTQEQFTERWMSDAAWRQALIKEYNMARRGESLILRKDSPYIVTEYTTPDGKTRKRKVSAAGAILIATGDHGRRVQAANKTLAHETVHAIVGLLRDTGVLTPETVKALRKEYGDPAHGVDELFNEEVFADALMTEAGYGLEMLERAAGEATRRKQNAVARALRGIADLFMGGGDFVLSRGAEGNITGLTISENADRGAPLARYRNRAVLNSLRSLAQQAADIYNATERARSLERLGRIRQGIHERIAKRREEAAKQAETEAERQQRDDELMALVDSDLSAMAEEAHAIAETELNTTRVSIEQTEADIRENYKGFDPKDEGEAAKLIRAKGRELIAHWRELKNRELELLRELADINIDPSARREYLIASENEAHRLQGQAARQMLDETRRRINETPVADGDALLANTRAIGHVQIESRESYIRRKMAENGWDRQTAIGQATHLYPEDMADLRAPWANRNLYTSKNGHSPDTASQALYDDGRISDPTVDAFWDAVRGDIETIGKAKKREIEAAEAEVASVLEWGKQRHLQNLADIEAQRDWREDPEAARSSIGGRGRGYIGNRWSVNAQDAMDRGMKTEAQVAQSLGISYTAWMGNRPFSGNGADDITGVLDEKGRDIHVSDLLDLSHEWHHVGKNYDEVTFVDPDEFYDVKSAGDIEDRQEAGLFWLYTRMREYPRQIDRNKLSREEADQALAIEHEMALKWEESVKPSRDAFVRAIASEADVDTLRALGDAFQKAMHEHKLARDERTKAFLGQIGKPNAYLNWRPRRNSGVRSSISGLFTGARVPYAKADLRFVGTGEHSQVYGWGLYASAVRDIAQNTYGMGFVEDGLHRITRSYSGNPHGGEREYATFFAVLRDLMVSEKKYKTDASTIPLIEEARQAIIAAKKDEIAHGNVSRERLWFLQDQIEAMEKLDPEKVILELDPNVPAVHEQVWWTHRPEGDESHLLNWYEPISNELREAILAQARKEKLKLTLPEGREGFNVYYDVETAIRASGHSAAVEKEASEFLYRAGVDGIKYPADAYGKPQNKDGRMGWNYVAFSDENLQVERRWIWDEAAEEFVLDRSFTPPPPTMAEARSSISGALPDVSGIRGLSNERVPATLQALAGFAGNKTSIVTNHPRFFRALGNLAREDGGRVIDAFAGIGGYTTSLGALRALPKGSVLNEWSIARYTLHKALAEDPEAVSDAVRDITKRLENSEEVETYRNALNESRENSDADQKRVKKNEAVDQLVKWFNDELNGKHGVTYVAAPGNSAYGDAQLNENAQTAALYIIIQNLSTQSRPINFIWDEKTGEAKIDVAGKKFDRSALALNTVRKGNHTKETIFSATNYTRRIDAIKDYYKNITVTRRDGWEVARTANKGDVVFVDPAYLGVQAYGGSKSSKTSRDAHDAEEAIQKLVNLANTAIENGFSIVYTNEFSDKSKTKKLGRSQEQYADIWNEAMRQIWQEVGQENASIAYVDRGKKDAADVVIAIGKAQNVLEQAIKNVRGEEKPRTQIASRASASDTTTIANPAAEVKPEVDPRSSIGGWLRDRRKARRLARETRDDEAMHAKAYAEGDRETAAALVERQAMRSRYIYEAWRGTNDFGGTNLGMRGDVPNHAIFFASSPEMAGTYADDPTVREVGTGDQSGSGVYHVALRFDNPLVVNAQGRTWDAIPYGDWGGVVSTDYLAHEARMKGNDGVIIRNIQDYNIHISHGEERRPGTVYIVLNPAHAKSLDPFTFDNDGNLIPLGQRFETSTPDIRSSIAGRETLRLPRETEADAQDPRSALGGIERGARAASLYFGRSPTQADIASRAIIEAGLFATGRKQSANKVIEAYRDIGVTISPEDAAEVANRINTNLEEQKTARARRVKPGEEPRDNVFTLDAILAQAYDENWKKAEKEAFAKGVSGTFGAAREMARDVQEAMEARRKEAEAVTGTAPAIIETELGFDIEASLLAAPEQIKTKVEIGKQQKQTEEERKAALEEARREDEASGPDGVAPEPTVEQMGFTESKLDEYNQKRRELRERSRKVEEEYEEKRKEAKKKYQKKETDDKQNAKEEEDNYLEFCESLRVSLNGIAFDLDNPPSVREFVNCMIHFVAEQRAGKKITRLRELREAFADPLVVRDAARTLAQIAEDLANRLVPSASRELIVKKAMTLAAAETIGQVRALATGALLSIRNVRIRQGRTELRDAMVKMIQSVKGRGRTVVGKEDSERKVSGDLERWLEDIEKALTLGEAALESMRTAAYATIVGLSEHGKTQKELVDFRDYMKAMRTISAIDKFGSWRHMTLAGLDDLRVELERMINGGLEAHERKMRQMEAKIDDFVQPLIDAMTQHAPDFKPDENAPLRERIANALDRHLGLQSLLFEALIGKSTGETRQKAQRAVRDLLNEFSAASAKYEATLLAWRAEIQDIIIRNYGSTRAFMERMHTPVPEDLRAHLTNRRTDAQEQAGREARQKTRITYGQALQLYASLVQRDYAQNARIHHRDGADFDALHRNLSDADVAFIAECSRFMKRIFPDLQAEYAEVTGVTVGTTPNYWPVKIDYPRSGLSAEVRAWTPIVAAMEPRRRNGLDFKEEVSAEQMLFSRLDEWARMLAYGKLGVISAAVFGNGDVINAITNSIGTKMALRIQENIKTALMGPLIKGDNFLVLSTRWASAFAMAANVGVAFKQFAGIPNFALKLGTKETVAAWWGGVTRLADDEWDADWAILTASDSYKARYGGAGLNAEMRAALQGATPGAVGGATAKAYDFGFKLQSVADRVVAKPFAIHAFRMYREAYLREGLTAAEAQRRAVIDAWALVEDTQQSARPENQLQSVNTSRIIRMLTQFRSSQLQQLQWEMRAWAAFLRGEEGAKQKLARVIFINHILAPLFWTAFDALWQAMLGLLGPGDEDDEEKMEGRRERRLEMWISDLALGAILGQLTAVPVLGGAFVAVYNRIVSNVRRRAEGKEPKPITTTEIVTEVTDVPAIRSAADIMATVYNLGLAATEVEMRDVASEADDFLKTAIPPYRDISKGAEQWGLGDLDNLWEEEE